MNFFSRLVRQDFMLKLVAYGVMANGLLLLTDTLLADVTFVGDLPRAHIAALVTSIPLLEGLTLIYLATLLRRYKRNAWLVVLPVYVVTLLTSFLHVLRLASHHELGLVTPAKALLVPVIVVYGLIRYRKAFTVKSDSQSFALAARTSILVLVIALAYGVAGFTLLDQRDFRQQVTIPDAIHRTIDQFDLTTGHELHSYTRRSKLFLDSLSIISVGSLVYAFVALFQPLRARLSDQTHNREEVITLLEKHPASSEDFFKLWPQDKTYFINRGHTAAVAYHVQRGIALMVGDPVGKQADFKELLRSFHEFCRVNDWLPAIIHGEPKHNQLYQKQGYSLQKIGEEAVIDVAHFINNVQSDKYFRQIRNKFTKQGYYTEVLQPPHNPAIIARLREVSNDWLKLPGRSERGFMMGYFSDVYMQQCPVMVLRDAAGTIQAFINQIPSYDKHEANYDLLRHTTNSLTNSNDFLMLNFINYLHEQSFMRFNLGLCPLSGLDNSDQETTVIDNLLKFVYANGDRFYSFSGLRRYKAKYEPEWSSRYIAYKGGIRGFTRTINALNKAMSRTKAG